MEASQLITEQHGGEPAVPAKRQTTLRLPEELLVAVRTRAYRRRLTLVAAFEEALTAWLETSQPADDANPPGVDHV